MALLDTIIQMHQQGINDTEIAQRLKEQGVNAKEINEAINQSKIKSAVEDNQDAMAQQAGMQPSVMEQPQPQEQIQEQVQQQYYPPQEQTQYEYYQPQQQGISADTVTEIAEQIISEKFLKVKKQLDSIIELKSISESKISGIDERLRKIEMIIEKLQISILEKVGSYGSAIQDIKGEMEMMQDSFSKAINPMIDKTRKQEVPEQKFRKKEIKNQENNQQNNQSANKKDSDGFENYLR